MSVPTPSTRRQPEQASRHTTATERVAASQDILVIGYGNELRGDDGLGPSIATAVSDWQQPGLRAVSCHQLAPELAESIAAARMVIFVDAALVAIAPAVQVCRLESSAGIIPLKEPLTPTLSPPACAGTADRSDGEREFSPVPVERLLISNGIPGSTKVLSLPLEKGEGRGEGLRPLNRHGLESVQIMTHSSDPQSLLVLARTVFGRCPPAWSITVPAVNLDFGERLSPAAERGKTEALEQIRRLVEEADQPPATRLSRQAGNGEVQTMA